MKLVFFGTPNFASRCFQKIVSSEHRILTVVTALDRPKGRGRKLQSPEVKKIALSCNIPVMQPANLKDPSFIEKLASFKADFFCVVAFRILPEEIFRMPPLGCVNLHASLLPKYRGAAPINWALIKGETETGLTTFFIGKKVDAGNIILQEKIKINPEETFGELHDRMAEVGGELLIKTMDLIESGNFSTAVQDESQSTPAPKLTPELGRIDWSKPAWEVHNLIRGLSPNPAAYSFRDKKRLDILRARIIDELIEEMPGKLIKAQPKEGVVVACKKGALELVEVKPESGKLISGAEYVRGYRIKTGEIFGG